MAEYSEELPGAHNDSRILGVFLDYTYRHIRHLTAKWLTDLENSKHVDDSDIEPAPLLENEEEILSYLNETMSYEQVLESESQYRKTLDEVAPKYFATLPSTRLNSKEPPERQLEQIFNDLYDSATELVLAKTDLSGAIDFAYTYENEALATEAYQNRRSYRSWLDLLEVLSACFGAEQPPTSHTNIVEGLFNILHLGLAELTQDLVAPAPNDEAYHDFDLFLLSIQDRLDPNSKDRYGSCNTPRQLLDLTKSIYLEFESFFAQMPWGDRVLKQTFGLSAPNNDSEPTNQAPGDEEPPPRLGL